MKYMFALSLLLVGHLALAQTKEEIRKNVYEGLTTCDQAVYTDDDYMASSLPTGVMKTGHIRLINLNDTQDVTDFPAKDRVVDIKIRQGVVYVLTQTAFEAWNIKQKTALFSYPSHPYSKAVPHWRERASGFILNGDHAVISHGILGASVLDIKTGAFIKTIRMPTLSSAQDIAAVNASTAVLAIDNDAEATFRGMYLMDLNSYEFSKQIRVDNAFPSAVRVLDNNRLMLIYFNAVWKFDLNTALKSEEARPNRRTWQYPGVYLVDMVGKVAFDKKNLYACMNLMDEKTGARKVKPMAFDLETLKLN